MAWIRAPSETRVLGMHRTRPSGNKPVHSYAEPARMRKIQSCRSRRKKAGGLASQLFRQASSPVILRHYSEGRWFGFVEVIVTPRSFSRNVLGTVQELHLRLECGRCDFAANTECNVTRRTRLRTKM